jgi:hypothetical protein
VRPEQPPGLGEREAASGPGEERDAELGLEPADLLGEARLGQMQLLGGGGERAVLGGGQEVGELLERYRRFLGQLKSSKPTPMAHVRR